MRKTRKKLRPLCAMLQQGTIDFETPEFKLTLVRSSQTVAALKPKR
jgi:hypothetical protein